MSTDTLATIIVAIADQATAQAFLPDTAGCFNTRASADGNEPASHVFTQGWWANPTIDALVNENTFPRTVIFGDDWNQALESKGLQMIVQQQEG